jgi:alginate O-acetyltransferase complex protein AlgI
MAFSTLVSYAAGVAMLRWKTGWARRLCLIVPVTIDLSLLALFKYVDLALTSAAGIARTFGITLHVAPLGFVLPVGISFYTFHTITYIVDSYRGVIVPTRRFFEFACYVSFFAQLVAGPIVRFRQVQHDLEHLGEAERRENLDTGFSFFTIGMIKKVLIADTIAAVIDPAWKQVSALSTLDAWLIIVGYTYQLYFDFSGYSDMAVGLGRLFGIHLPQNFDAPYRASDPSDFWRRWHISLSTVLRDYLYIPLGGSRGSEGKTVRNLMLTMALGGLWHGANWTFVFWGCYHGVLLVAYRYGKRFWDPLPAPARRAGMFLLVILGWVFFRAPDFSTAGALLFRMFRLIPGAPIAGEAGLVLAISVAAVSAHLGPTTFEMRHEWRPATVLGLTSLFVLSLIVILGGRATPFLYFQF